MATVRDYMATELTVLSPDEGVLQAMRRMLDARVSGAPVVDEHGSLVGILTQRDCLMVAYRTSYHGEPAGKVADSMTQTVETVPADTDLVEVIGYFFERPHRRFAVVEGNQLVGVISRRDVLRAVLELA
ncbi:MAG: CBS domain-containing protein [Myxococcales bacterium]|nr:CBS domain-containing protein [Myxococcales bacterium]